jgi:hypothetical protein
MVKDGEDISKFSMDDVYEVSSNAQQILQKVYILYDKYVGEEKVFRSETGRLE